MKLATGLLSMTDVVSANSLEPSNNDHTKVSNNNNEGTLTNNNADNCNNTETLICNNDNAETPINDQQPLNEETQTPPKKKPRRRYDNNLKAQILDELKVPGTKLPAVAKKHGIPENTLRDWTKVSVVASIEAARQNHGGTLKANMYDPLEKLTKNLMRFFDQNNMQPEHLKVPVTTRLVVHKGLEARSNLLEQHEVEPFLDPKEKRSLETFTGSDSWAKKFAKRHDLRMTGARAKELSEDDVKKYVAELKTMATRMRKAGRGYEEVAVLLNEAQKKLVNVRSNLPTRTGSCSGVIGV